MKSEERKKKKREEVEEWVNSSKAGLAAVPVYLMHQVRYRRYVPEYENIRNGTRSTGLNSLVASLLLTDYLFRRCPHRRTVQTDTRHEILNIVRQKFKQEKFRAWSMVTSLKFVHLLNYGGPIESKPIPYKFSGSRLSCFCAS